MFQEIKLKELKRPSQEVIDTLQRAVNCSVKRWVEFFKIFSAEDVKRMGGATALGHLAKIVDYINKSNNNEFCVRCMCNIQLFDLKISHKEPVLELTNGYILENPIYRSGYEEVFDTYFDAPIVKSWYGIICYNFKFRV